MDQLVPDLHAFIDQFQGLDGAGTEGTGFGDRGFDDPRGLLPDLAAHIRDGFAAVGRVGRGWFAKT